MRSTTPERAGPGQESVWDYPRPPALDADPSPVQVTLGGVVVARTTGALRVLETSHPPTYYLPMTDFAEGSLRPCSGGSVCEWKGRAAYLDVVGGPAEPGSAGAPGDRRGPVVAAAAGWTYPDPTPAFAALRGYVALYPRAMDSVQVDGEDVSPQPGGFYGGWVTSRVVGPFKGEPGTLGW